MIIHKGYEGRVFNNPVVTLGIFDGVHLGHIAIIRRLLSYSREINGESVVMTFDPHPRMVLDNSPGIISLLTTPEEKQELIAAAGVDHLVIIDFTTVFSSIPATAFVKNILADKIRTRILIVGHDHHFGYKGGGDYNSIKEFALEEGIITEQVGKLEIDGVVVSSSAIRDALLDGNIELANRLLGYNYSLKGIVIRGKPGPLG